MGWLLFTHYKGISLLIAVISLPLAKQQTMIAHSTNSPSLDRSKECSPPIVVMVKASIAPSDADVTVR